MKAVAPPAAARSRGRLISWNDERGFGFIAPDGGGQDVFVHASAFAKEGRHIEVGGDYEFDLDISKDGRPKAKRVAYVAVPKARPSVLSQFLQRGPRFLVIAAFLFIVVAISTVSPVSPASRATGSTRLRRARNSGGFPKRSCCSSASSEAGQAPSSRRKCSVTRRRRKPSVHCSG